MSKTKVVLHLRKDDETKRIAIKFGSGWSLSKAMLRLPNYIRTGWILEKCEGEGPFAEYIRNEIKQYQTAPETYHRNPKELARAALHIKKGDG